MKRTTIGWLIAAGLLLLVGVVCFGGGMLALDWDFSKLSTATYVTRDYPITENYENIHITVDTAHVTFVPSEAGTTVTCREQENLSHTVTVEEGTLTIRVKDTRKWYDYIGIVVKSPRITVALPQGAYDTLTVQGHTGDVKVPGGYRFEQGQVALSTGDIQMEGVTAGKLELSVSTGHIDVSRTTCLEDINLSVSTGDITVEAATCRRFTSRGSTGDVCLTGLLARETLAVRRTTGDVTLTGCDAGELELQTNTGNVTGTLLTPKAFSAATDTGRVQVPREGAGGPCRITTSTGDIKIALADD